MYFNRDPNKQAVEIIFLEKGVKPSHSVYFSGFLIKTVSHQKHPGLNLDWNLSYSHHFDERKGIAKRGSGVNLSN